MRESLQGRAIVETFDQDGYAIVSGLAADREVTAVARALERLHIPGAGTRNLLRLSWCRALAQRLKVRLTHASALHSSFMALQCTLFDKTPECNWLVAFHQDLSIPVWPGIVDPSRGLSSEKEGEKFVQASSEILETLVAVRIHIDDCGAESGPLRVVPGSHHSGRLDDSARHKLRVGLGETQCVVRKGDAVLMRPLILHASSKATTPSRRRVLHYLFGPTSALCGLESSNAV